MKGGRGLTVRDLGKELGGGGVAIKQLQGKE